MTNHVDQSVLVVTHPKLVRFVDFPPRQPAACWAIRVSLIKQQIERNNAEADGRIDKV
jgi:hypothetical protein